MPGGDSGDFPEMPSGPADIEAMADEGIGCVQKLHEMCCADTVLEKELCVPTHWCLVAIGQLPTGPYPGCPAPSIGDASKCKKDEPTLKSIQRDALEQCNKQLQDLYDKQSSLLECAHTTAMCKAELEEENAKTQEFASEEQACKTGQKDEASVDSMKSKSRYFCSNYEILEAPMTALGVAQVACLESQMPKVEIPEIQIDIPDIDVGTFGDVTAPGFEVDIAVPEFEADISDVVIPGGGGKLDVPAPQGQEPITIEKRTQTIQGQIDTCESSKKQCASAKEAATSSRLEQEQKKKDSCEPSLRRLQSHEDEKQVIIGMLEAEKTNPFFTKCADVTLQVDVVIAAINLCQPCDAACQKMLQGIEDAAEDAVAEATKNEDAASTQKQDTAGTQKQDAEATPSSNEAKSSSDEAEPSSNQAKPSSNEAEPSSDQAAKDAAAAAAEAEAAARPGAGSVFMQVTFICLTGVGVFFLIGKVMPPDPVAPSRSASGTVVEMQNRA